MDPDTLDEYVLKFRRRQSKALWHHAGRCLRRWHVVQDVNALQRLDALLGRVVSLRIKEPDIGAVVTCPQHGVCHWWYGRQSE